MIKFLKKLLSDRFKNNLKILIRDINKYHPYKIFNNYKFYIKKNSKPIKILITPTKNDKHELNELYWRIIYYLYPVRNKIESITFVSDLEFSPLEKPKSLTDELNNFTSIKNKIYFKTPNEIKSKFFDLILMSDEKNKFIFKRFKYSKNYLIDYIENKEASEWMINISYDLKDQNELDYVLDSGKEKFIDLKGHIQNKKILLCGSGPSIEKLRDVSDEYDVMICNSIVKNDEFLEKCKPKYLCFADPIFHPGPSKYAEQFRKYVKKVIHGFNTTIFTLLRDYPIYRELFSVNELENFIFLPMQKSEKYNYDLEKNFYIKGSGNILTLLMFPIAFNLYNQIDLAGFDGKKINNDDYYWKHSSHNQYEKLLDDIKFVHPGYFAKENDFYNFYYQNHLNTVDIWKEIAKNDSKLIASITESNIFN